MQARRGFTMVEVLFSVGVIALLIGLLLVGVSAMNRAARSAIERQNVTSLKMAVDHFKDSFGFLPPLVYDGHSHPPDGFSSSDSPVKDRDIAGVTRPAPVTYTEESDKDWYFLRGREPSGAQSDDAHLRYSTHSIAFYLIGALGEEVDGVPGPGFLAPQPDGSFRTGGPASDPLFDLSKNAEGLYIGDAKKGEVQLRDRNGLPYRYYRWIQGNEDGQIIEPADMNVPALVGDPATEPQLRSATWAIVAAGPNRVFGDEDPQDLIIALGGSASVDEQRLRTMAREDNIVEVGQ